jgi:cytochrome bd ubiquinol oxidase subunit II
MSPCDERPRSVAVRDEAAYDVTVDNSASGSYALKVMTIVTVIFLPLVLGYQEWSFYLFRARVKAPPSASPGAPKPPGGGLALPLAVDA